MKIVILFLTCMGFIVLINAMERRDNGPLPAEHFENIREGSIISIMIRGNDYVEHGELYEHTPGDENSWMNHVYYAGDTGNIVVAERVYVKVVDPGRSGQPPRPTHHFAASLRRQRNVQGQMNQVSQCFIKQGDHVYRAPLSPITPNSNDSASLIFVLGEYLRHRHVRLCGVLDVFPHQRAGRN